MVWDISWAATKAGEAMHYLAQHYPESAGSLELHPHQDAAREASVVEYWEAYLEALRGYMRVGRDEALRIRKGEAA
jgi:hypothetical protein